MQVARLFFIWSARAKEETEVIPDRLYSPQTAEPDRKLFCIKAGFILRGAVGAKKKTPGFSGSFFISPVVGRSFLLYRDFLRIVALSNPLQ